MTFDKTVQQYLQESTVFKDNLGTIRYYKDLNRQILHRTEKDPKTGLTLPAVIWNDGIHKEWWKDDMCHRDEKDPVSGLYLPAVVQPTLKLWFKNDKHHRTDGPAIEWASGNKEWWINGKQITEKEFNDYLKRQEITKEITGHKNNRIDPGMLEDYL